MMFFSSLFKLSPAFVDWYIIDRGSMELEQITPAEMGMLGISEAGVFL